MASQICNRLTASWQDNKHCYCHALSISLPRATILKILSAPLKLTWDQFITHVAKYIFACYIDMIYQSSLWNLCLYGSQKGTGTIGEDNAQVSDPAWNDVAIPWHKPPSQRRRLYSWVTNDYWKKQRLITMSIQQWSGRHMVFGPDDNVQQDIGLITYS